MLSSAIINYCLPKPAEQSQDFFVLIGTDLPLIAADSQILLKEDRLTDKNNLPSPYFSCFQTVTCCLMVQAR
jgi:hypothetical protein